MDSRTCIHSSGCLMVSDEWGEFSYRLRLLPASTLPLTQQQQQQSHWGPIPPAQQHPHDALSGQPASSSSSQVGGHLSKVPHLSGGDPESRGTEKYRGCSKGVLEGGRSGERYVGALWNLQSVCVCAYFMCNLCVCKCMSLSLCVCVRECVCVCVYSHVCIKTGHE